MFELALPLFSDFNSVLFDSLPQPNFMCLCIREQVPFLNTSKKKRKRKKNIQVPAVQTGLTCCDHSSDWQMQSLPEVFLIWHGGWQNLCWFKWTTFTGLWARNKFLKFLLINGEVYFTCSQMWNKSLFYTTCSLQACCVSWFKSTFLRCSSSDAVTAPSRWWIEIKWRHDRILL